MQTHPIKNAELAALTETQVRAESAKLRGRQFEPMICDMLLSNPVYPKLFDQDVPLTLVIAATSVASLLLLPLSRVEVLRQQTLQ